MKSNMKSIKKLICVFVIVATVFSAFADMRLMAGAGLTFNILEHDYYDDGYKRSSDIIPAFTPPTLLFGIPTETDVTPVVGAGFATLLFANLVKVSAGVSIELPKTSFFVQELMFIGNFNYYFMFVSLGVAADWYLTFEVPYMFSFPSKKGFWFGAGPQFLFTQHGNYSHYHRFDIGIETFVGVRW